MGKKESKMTLRFLAGSHSGWGSRASRPRGCAKRSTGPNTNASGCEAKHELFHLGCLIFTDFEENNKPSLKEDKHSSHQTRPYIQSIRINIHGRVILHLGLRTRIRLSQWSCDTGATFPHFTHEQWPRLQ